MLHLVFNKAKKIYIFAYFKFGILKDLLKFHTLLLNKKISIISQLLLI